jgi:hypothetical protein
LISVKYADEMGFFLIGRIAANKTKRHKPKKIESSETAIIWTKEAQML